MPLYGDILRANLKNSLLPPNKWRFRASQKFWNKFFGVISVRNFYGWIQNDQ
jgi:hypothetical protein